MDFTHRFNLRSFRGCEGFGFALWGSLSGGRAVSVADEVMARVLVGAASSDRGESLA